MDQSGARSMDFCLYKLAPVWLREPTSPFQWRLCFPRWADTEDVSPEQRGAAQCRPEQTGTEESNTGQSRPKRSRAKLSARPQSHLAPGLPPSPAVFTAITKRLVSQWGCSALNAYYFFTTPQIRDSCWLWIGTNNHQLTKANPNLLWPAWIFEVNLPPICPITKIFCKFIPDLLNQIWFLSIKSN